MRTCFILLAGLFLAAVSACSGSGVSEATPTPVPRPANQMEVSDEVPSMEELLETGLSTTQAECFISTIDPDSTGRVQNEEFFMAALSECL